MKGIIFTSLSDMIEEKYGLETWTKMLDEVNPPSKGIYTAGGTYDDAELVAYITKLSQLENTAPNQLIETFGIYLFPVLANKYPIFLQNDMTFKEFMISIDKIIHVEVHKLYPEASLPTINYEDPSPNQLIMIYRSPRKLCALAKGLSKGAADYFNVSIHINEPLCMHNGDDYCRLEVNIEG